MNKKKQRIIKVLLFHSIIIGLGLLYLIIIKISGWSIPCLFNKITNLKCPGCGLTTLFISLSNLDFVNAFLANPITFCILPLIIIGDIYYSYKYIQNGYYTISKKIEILIIIFIIIYVSFGFLRNLFTF